MSEEVSSEKGSEKSPETKRKLMRRHTQSIIAKEVKETKRPETPREAKEVLKDECAAPKALVSRKTHQSVMLTRKHGVEEAGTSTKGKSKALDDLDYICEGVSESDKKKARHNGACFEKGEVLGNGYQGTTFAGRAAAGEDVVIKQVKMSYIGEPMVRALRKAMPRLKCLEHNNLIAYKGIAYQNHTFYVITSFCHGTGCDSLITRHGLFSEQLAAAVAAPILDVLSYLHGNGIIHGDLCPSNIIIDSATGNLIVSDILIRGLVPMRQFEGPLSAAGIHGRPHFLAPEIAALSPGPVPKSDIWALGCLIYNLLTGMPPNCDMHPIAALAAILDREYKVELSDTFSDELKDFLGKCFTHSHEERPDAKTLLAHPFITKHAGTNLKDLLATYTKSKITGRCGKARNFSAAADNGLDVTFTNEDGIMGAKDDQHLLSDVKKAVKKMKDGKEVSRDTIIKLLEGCADSLAAPKEEVPTQELDHLKDLLDTVTSNVRGLELRMAYSKDGGAKLPTYLYRRLAADSLDGTRSGVLEHMPPDGRRRKAWVVLKHNFLFIYKKSKNAAAIPGDILCMPDGFKCQQGPEKLQFSVMGQQFWANSEEDLQLWVKDINGGKPWYFTEFGLGCQSVQFTPEEKSMPSPTEQKLLETRFGVSPTDLARADPSDTDPNMPALVESLCVEIEARGAKQEGIFRESGDYAKGEALQAAYNKAANAKDVDISKIDVSTLAMILKSWLKMMPGSFVEIESPSPLLESFLKCQTEESAEVVEEVRKVMQTAPPANVAVLKRICQLVNAIVSHEDVNKMTMENMMTCLVPSMKIEPRLFSCLIKNIDKF